MLPSPPESEAELRERAHSLAGLTFAQVAAHLGQTVPEDLRRAKGFPGRLLETALGASSGSRAEPDFPQFGVELKTLPVEENGRVCESTFVCRVALSEIGETEWENSWLKRKLARVLWIPIDGARHIPVGERRIGSPLFWTPDEEEQAWLKFDWEELAGLVGRGEVEAITGHIGRYLQIRPKAAHGRSRGRARDRDGARLEVMPRGFYLRAAFTERLLQKHFSLPPRRP